MSTSLTSEIQAAEAALREAMMTSNVPHLDHLLADNLVFTNHLGQVMTKQADLEAHRSGAIAIHQLDLSDQQITLLGQVAVVTVAADISGTFAAQPFATTLRFTRVWQAQAPGRWQVRIAQATAVVHPA
ncbi:nuclear transport factor 2 family protein [Leptolyngbya iicbica]|uniref:Nuclear transport factor 2 family protein n=2 Tax=Cyanophyceae TaxID=3028117 RepID=A0A4V2E3G3_9CYAN|nr:nuclear transport factor 2 family protein [Leptolyngbya sp. LK]RZM82340.1 nuclear transport factor 2 family protein [Leptolyngbya sp. LK]